MILTDNRIKRCLHENIEASLFIKTGLGSYSKDLTKKNTLHRLKLKNCTWSLLTKRSRIRDATLRGECDFFSSVCMEPINCIQLRFFIHAVLYRLIKNLKYTKHSELWQCKKYILR